ncbi:hypothetical protein HUG17_0419 [Dermatophagoides farinae]|uniref:SUEL-type lectin domain-containing protein n=1 Tax=Dermatophagoides farinae TaxID=6954 RepID=A0A9D4P607_DERFA|nr:hypothetical protein HUG17_0419 [Dermatophagoides farinae]
MWLPKNLFVMMNNDNDDNYNNDLPSMDVIQCLHEQQQQQQQQIHRRQLQSSTSSSISISISQFPNDYNKSHNKRISLTNVPNNKQQQQQQQQQKMNILSLLNYSILLFIIWILSSLFLVQSISLPINNNNKNNNLPLLAGTLRTYQVSACDNEELHLECDSRTVVNIVVANYGQPVPQRHMCYRRSSPSITTTTTTMEQWPLDHISEKSTISNDASSSSSLSSSSPVRCSEAKHLWYKFLLKIEETCREQHRCVLQVNATNLGFKYDPCGNVIKFAEVVYRCRPNQFINKIACEGRSLKLQCNENNDQDDRIVIFSAMFGASWKGVHECPGSAINQLGPAATTNRFPNQTNIETLCQDRYAPDIVQRICQGRRNCTIMATYDNNHITTLSSSSSSSFSNRTFALPTCPILVKYYLKIVYTCISKHMFHNDHRIESITTSTSTPTSISSSTTTTTTTTTTMTTMTTTTKTVRPIISSTNMIDDDDNNESINDNDDYDDGGDGRQQQQQTFASNKKKMKYKTNTLDMTINYGGDDDDNLPSVSPVSNKNRTLSSNTRLMMDSASVMKTVKSSWRTRLPHHNSGSSSRDSVSQVLMDNPNQQHHHSSINCTELTAQMQVVGFISDWISAIGFVKRNQELFVLYLLVSLFGSLVCFLAVLSARLYYQKGVAVKKVRQEHQQQRKFVPQFDFEDDLEDEEEEEDDDNGGGGGDRNQQTAVSGDHEEIQHILIDNRRPSSMQAASVGRCDYGQSKRQSMTGVIGSATTSIITTTSSSVASTSAPGYSTIRRPQSGHIAASGGQSSTIAGYSHHHPSYHLHHHHQTTSTKPMISTLGRPRHHHHHHKPSNPTVRYSGTTTRTSLSVSPNTTTATSTTSPKSILRDSAVQTPTPMSMMVMEMPSSSSRPPITTATTVISSPNYRGTTISFENDQLNQISTIDLIPPPPPPLLSAELMATGSNLVQSTSSPMGRIDSPIVSCDTLYQQIVRCPKFPITPNHNNTIEPYGMPITTTSDMSGKQQSSPSHPTMSTVTTTPIIHSQQTSLSSNEQTAPATSESKLLSSSLANFLV